MAGFLVQAVKKGGGQKVLEGGLNRVVYDIIQNELIGPSEGWWKKNLGGDYAYGYDGYDYGYQPGDIETDDSGRSYMLGEDNQWRQLPEETAYGQLTPVGPLGALTPVGPLGAETVPVGPLGSIGVDDPYRRAFLQG